MRKSINVKIILKLNLPDANRERETPVLMSGCTNDDHSFVSCSSGIVPPHQYSVPIWGSQFAFQWVLGAIRRLKRTHGHTHTKKHTHHSICSKFRSAWAVQSISHSSACCRASVEICRPHCHITFLNLKVHQSLGSYWCRLLHNGGWRHVFENFCVPLRRFFLSEGVRIDYSSISVVWCICLSGNKKQYAYCRSCCLCFGLPNIIHHLYIYNGSKLICVYSEYLFPYTAECVKIPGIELSVFV
jgi:hypothetical protein